jgi:hypothetical protein
VARARRRWIREQGLLDTTHLVFIDETSVNTNMTRLYGRAPRGERVIGRVPFSAWKTVTFVAAQTRRTGVPLIASPTNTQASRILRNVCDARAGDACRAEALRPRL